MPFIVDKKSVDTISTSVCCIYPPKELGGETIKAAGVYFQGDRVEFYINGTKCSDVPCERTPVPDPPCNALLTQPLTRNVVTSKNRNVYINNQLFAIQGDLAQGLSTKRPIVGPYKYSTIHIANTP